MHILVSSMNPLRAARKRGKLTQRELASLVGVTQAHISAVENRVDRASAELAEKLVKAIGRHAISEEEILYPERFEAPKDIF
ncbi:helix-turn-helix transcriptional regulator [Azonexus sp.]|uniref:helix-turn-helix transcriptional regulator n=1 Tax=Azonexus sp. TaxID=1872668 RepID=UPI00283860E0|nr:helix-turn-helix transcriptional regulator [Azonexus sp.]MDR1994196.1 helix-turn-helix transcriptional regulator [Azonexus sp.]